ncbi:hypothetical protein [Streptomyces misionensis]
MPAPASSRDAGSYPWSFSGMMGLAERCLDPAEAVRLEAPGRGWFRRRP